MSVGLDPACCLTMVLKEKGEFSLLYSSIAFLDFCHVI